MHDKYWGKKEKAKTPMLTCALAEISPRLSAIAKLWWTADCTKIHRKIKVYQSSYRWQRQGTSAIHILYEWFYITTIKWTIVATETLYIEEYRKEILLEVNIMKRIAINQESILKTKRKEKI